MTDTFTCAMCGAVESMGNDDAARAELRETFGDVPVSECAVACDNCWAKVKP